MTGLLWVEGVGADLVSGAELVAADAADAGLGVVVHDGAGVIVGANDVAGESLGLSWDQLVGRTSRDRRWSAVSEQGLALTGDQHPAMRTLATGEPVEDFLMGVLIPAGASAGRTQWLSISTYPVGVPVVGVAAVFTDVSGTTVGKVADQMLTSQQSIAAGQRFASMFYGHAAVMLLIDPDTGAIVDANQAAADFYGYTIDELRSMSIDRINVLPDEQVALRRAQALAGDRNHFVFGHQLANGQIRSVQVHSSPIADHGRTLLFSIITDVTERERVEAQLRQAAAVFDNTLESVVITDAAVVVRQVNAAFTDLTGWEPESIVGRHAHVLGRDTTKAEDAQRIRDAIQAGDGVRGEVSIRHRDGAESPALLSVSAIPGPDGEVTGYVGVLSDLSERVRVERVLAEQAQQLESARSALAVENERRELVLSGTRLGLWDWNMVTGETVFDERWAQIVGYQLEDLQPTSIDTWTRFSHPDDLARSDELIKQCVQGLIPFYDAEVRMRHRGGRWVWVHDRGRIVEWTADGRPLRMTGTHEDITELVAARELVQAERVRLRATMDSLMDPHVLLEAVRDEAGMIVDFVYTDANPAACAYTGLDYQDLVGARLLDLLPGQAGSGLLQSYRQVVDTGEPLALDDVAYDQEV
ncbi:MAG: PAS domain S-box protein, partial [Actinomycetes bacterium]